MIYNPLKDKYLIISFGDGNDPIKVTLEDKAYVINHLENNAITEFLTEMPEYLDTENENLHYQTLIIGNLDGNIIVPRVKKIKVEKETLVID